MKVIENAFLKAAVEESGGQWMSVLWKKTGKELLWQRNPEIWGDCAPLLFPICGRLENGSYLWKDRQYNMGLHGFLRFQKPIRVESTSDSLTMVFRENAGTLEQYPFPFEITLTDRLEENRLIRTLTVKNPGTETLLFSVGGHPGFALPLGDQADLREHFVIFPEAGKTESYGITEAGLLSGETAPYALENQKVPLNEEMFRQDGLFLRNAGKIAELHCRNARLFLRLEAPEAICWGIWKVYGENAPFVCLEPWCGLPGLAGGSRRLEEKAAIRRLSPMETFAFPMILSVGED